MSSPAQAVRATPTTQLSLVPQSSSSVLNAAAVELWTSVIVRESLAESRVVDISRPSTVTVSR